MAASMQSATRNGDPITSVLRAISNSTMNVYGVQWDRVAGTILNSTDEKIGEIAANLITTYGSADNILREFHHLKNSLIAVAQHVTNIEPFGDNDLQQKIYDRLTLKNVDELLDNIEGIARFIDGKDKIIKSAFQNAERVQQKQILLPGSMSFVPLKDKIHDAIIEISPNLSQILCLNQNTLEGGNDTCGYHALKNAWCALVTANDEPIGTATNIFCDPILYDNMESNLLLSGGKRGRDVDSDISEKELRKGWNDILDGKIIPFPGAAGPINLKKNELSFFYVRDNSLVIDDQDSLLTLVHLKDLTKMEGPCYHAFIAGDEKHWVTIIYEKDAAGTVHWYGLDSLENGQDQFVQSIRLISEAMQNIDTLCACEYYERCGDEIEKLVKFSDDLPYRSMFITKEGFPIHLNNLMSELRFIKRIGWLDNPDMHLLARYFINNIKLILEHYVRLGVKETKIMEMLEDISKIGVSENTRDPVVLRNALAEIKFPGTRAAQDALSTLRSMTILSDDVKDGFLELIGRDHKKNRVANLEKLITLMRGGYSALLDKVITPGNSFQSQENWKIITDLMTLKVLPLPTGNPLLIRQFTDLIDFTITEKNRLENLLRWFSEPDNGELRKKIVQSLIGELENNSDPEDARKIALLIIHNDFIFAPEPGKTPNISEVLRNELSEALVAVERETDNAYINNSKNPYRLYRRLKEVQKEQKLIKIPFELDGKLYLLQPLTEQVIYRRGDIPPELKPQAIVHLFDALERRMESNPNLYLRAVEIAGEIEAHDTVDSAKDKFQKFRSKFFEDHAIARFMDLPEDESATIPRESFYLYSLLNGWLKESNIPDDGDSLSMQEKRFYHACNVLDGCGPMKGDKITALYRDLDPSSRPVKELSVRGEETIISGAGEELRKRLLSLVDFRDVYLEFVSKLFENESFIKKLIKMDKFKELHEPMHQKKYLKNRFGKLLGISQDVEFDLFSWQVLDRLLDVSQSDFKQLFYFYAQNFLTAIHRLITESKTKLNDEIIKNVDLINLRNKFMKDRNLFLNKKISEERFIEIERDFKEKIKAKGNPENKYQQIEEEKIEGAPVSYKPPASLCDDIKRLIEQDTNIFDYKYDEEAEPGEDYVICGIRDGLIDTLFQKLGIYAEKSPVLKIDSMKPVPFSRIISMLKKERPVSTLDLSHCTWLSGLDLKKIVRHSGAITTLNLTGCTQLTDDVINFLLLNNVYKRIKNIDLTGCTQLRRLWGNLRMPTLILPVGSDVKLLLDVSDKNMTDMGLITTLDDYSNLTSINLSRCSGLTDVVVDAILKKCPRLTSCNVTGCAGLSLEAIKKLPALPALDLDPIRKEFPGLNIIDAEFWESLEVPVDTIPPFEDASFEIRDFMKTLNLAGIEGVDYVEDIKDYTGATLMLLPRGLNLYPLIRKNFYLLHSCESYKSECEFKVVGTTCWMLIANGVLKGSRDMKATELFESLSKIKCEMPEMMAATALIAATYKMSIGKKSLFTDKPMTKTRCIDLCRGDSMSVGGLSFNNLTIHYHDYSYKDASIGVSPSRKYLTGN